MSDEALRALERLAAAGDDDAARELAVAKFRLDGNCRTGLCGNKSREARVVSQPTGKPKIVVPRACPTCLANERRRLAHTLVVTASKYPGRRAVLVSWLEGKPYQLQRDENIEDPSQLDRIWLAFALKLDRKGLAWVEGRKGDGRFQVRFDDRPEDAVPEKIGITGLWEKVSSWWIPRTTNADAEPLSPKSAELNEHLARRARGVE